MNKIGLIFSSRIRSALLCIIALSILAILGILSAEIVTSYFNGTGFDISIERTIIIEILLPLPYFVVAAFILHALAVRLTLFHTLREQITVSEHQPPAVLSPAEAGLLVHGGFTFNEVAATIRDLELRGCIAIDHNGTSLKIRRLDLSNADDIEQQFLNTLFNGNDYFSSDEPSSSPTFTAAGKTLVERSRDRLIASGQILPNNMQRIIRFSVNLLIVATTVIQTCFILVAILHTSETFNIGYPRYTMGAIEPLLELCSIILVLLVSLSGFKHIRLTDKNGLKNWRYVAGLKMYIEKNYKDRFYQDGHQIASENELKIFYPYAIAFGIENKFTNSLKQALSI